MNETYDYIIAGAGCAGLSLLQRMMNEPFFRNKKILLIDKSMKNKNDRTWCFWEKQSGVFESIVYHRWAQIDFYTSNYSARYDLDPYTYKMIRGIDLYEFVLNNARQNANIHFYTGNIKSITNENDKVVVAADDKMFEANYAFNSILFQDWKSTADKQNDVYVLLQHFKGLMIETEKPVFDERIATFMDFRIDQQQGTSFFYVLPITKNKALVEFTLFTEKLLEQHKYDEALKQYILTYLKLDKFKIIDEEFGVIPMTNFAFSKGENNIINIGTAGAQTKASSGYTFQFIQKHSDKIVNRLMNDQNPLIENTLSDKRFQLYDRVFLNVLVNKKMNGDKIFEKLFKNNKPQTVLKFLDNETNFFEDIKIMSSVPLLKFLPATLREIF